MTPDEHRELQRVIAKATATAKESGAPIAVIDHLYCENDDQRFQYAPTSGVNVLFNSEHYAVIGVAYPNGLFQRAGDLLALISIQRAL